jgi:hypothetical protein
MVGAYKKKESVMQAFMKDLPEPFFGLVCIAFGLIILLDAVGAIHANLLVIVGALIALWYGFVLVQGPKKIRRLLERVHINNKGH